MVDFWDLISATFFIIGKFRYPQNVSYRSCSDIAEYYLVRFWDPQVEIGLTYGLCKSHKSDSYSKICEMARSIIATIIQVGGFYLVNGKVDFSWNLADFSTL